jgi:hypothetical protein
MKTSQAPSEQGNQDAGSADLDGDTDNRNYEKEGSGS